MSRRGDRAAAARGKELREAIAQARRDLAAALELAATYWPDVYEPTRPYTPNAGEGGEMPHRGTPSRTSPVVAGDQEVAGWYIACSQAVASAHADLEQFTNLRRWRPVRLAGRHTVMGDSKPARIVPFGELQQAVRSLDANLVELSDPEVIAAMNAGAIRQLRDACRHATRARTAWPAEVRRRPQPPDKPKCVHCNSNDPEKDRRWCSACRKAHQRSKCNVCGLGFAGTINDRQPPSVAGGPPEIVHLPGAFIVTDITRHIGDRSNP